MDPATEITIRELTPQLLDDYLTFFDRDAFTDNPRWASCYCYFNHAPHHLQKWEDRTAADNRAAVSQRILAGQMHGYLAYDRDRPVAWCNAAPRPLITTLDDDQTSTDKIGSIVCFVVAKPYRGQQIARQLLEAACAGFLRQGFQIAEAYPRPGARGEAANHTGPLSLYLAAGFLPYRESGGTLIVRKTL